MKRMRKWLESNLPQRSAAEPHSPVEVISGETVEAEYIDIDETAVLPTLANVDESSFTVFDSTGFESYNSDNFGTSKSR